LENLNKDNIEKCFTFLQKGDNHVKFLSCLLVESTSCDFERIISCLQTSQPIVIFDLDVCDALCWEHFFLILTFGVIQDLSEKIIFHDFKPISGCDILNL